MTHPCSTATGNEPSNSIALSGTVADKDVLLSNVVFRREPLKTITLLFRKLVPVTVRVNEEAPATAVLGEIEIKV